MQVLYDCSRQFKAHLDLHQSRPRLLVEWDDGQAAIDLETWNLADGTKGGKPPEDLLEWLKASESYLRRWHLIMQMGLQRVAAPRT